MFYLTQMAYLEGNAQFPCKKDQKIFSSCVNWKSTVNEDMQEH